MIEGSHVAFKPLERFRRTLAACTGFRAWTGESGSVAAQDHIYYGSIPKPKGDKYTLKELQDCRPFVILSLSEAAGLTLRRTATGTWAGQGTVLAHFESDVDPSISEDKAAVDVQTLTTIGKIVKRSDGDPADFKGLCDLFHDGSDDYLAGENVVLDGHFRSDPQDHPGQGDFVYWLFEISWGI